MRLNDMIIGTDYAVRMRYLGNAVTRGRFISLDATGFRRRPFFMLADPATGKLLVDTGLHAIASQNVLHTWDAQLAQRAERVRLVTERQEADRLNAQAWKELLPRLNAAGLYPSGNPAYSSHMSLRLSRDEMAEFLRWKEADAARPQATEAQIAEARTMYATPHSPTIQVDDDAKLSISEAGTWVQAWVWLEDEDAEEQS